MPFTKPYREYFTKGDLVYGLATERPNFLVKFHDAWFNKPDVVMTVDHYRVDTVTTRKAEFETIFDDLVQHYFLPKQQKKYNLALYEKERSQNTVDNFAKELLQFHSDIEKHAKYRLYMAAIKPHGLSETVFAGQATEEVSNAAFRAKSKFGMEWTISKNKGMKLDGPPLRHIHFLLNKIDMYAVVTKTHRYENDANEVLAQDLPTGKAPANTDKVRTITHSELRWIFRNRGNPLVQASVQFWNEEEPCGPPWENVTETLKLPSGDTVTWKVAWQLYTPSMTHDTFA